MRYQIIILTYKKKKIKLLFIKMHSINLNNILIIL